MSDAPERIDDRPLPDLMHGAAGELANNFAYPKEMRDRLLLTELLIHAADHIAELEAERRWIPVEERLPKDQQTVIAFGPGVNEPEALEFFEGDWFDETGPVMDITHWMPLPEPPQLDARRRLAVAGGSDPTATAGRRRRGE